MQSECAGTLEPDRRPAAKFIFIGGKLFRHYWKVRIIHEMIFYVVQEKYVRYITSRNYGPRFNFGANKCKINTRLYLPFGNYTLLDNNNTVV